MNPDITSPDYKPEPMTARESARFHACACEPARRRHNPAPDQGVMFGQLGLLDVIAESAVADCPPVARQVIDLPELRGALDALAPGEDARCAFCERLYPVADIDPTGYCPECIQHYPRALMK